jgi:hypothetical protein
MFEVAKPLAYYDTAKIAAVKRFTVESPRSNPAHVGKGFHGQTLKLRVFVCDE